MSTFPQELIDSIIDRVAKTDGDEDCSVNLKACSLVCKSFHDRCTKHLFSSINLSYLRHFNTTQKDSPLERCPTIAQYIEHLTLNVSPILQDLIQRSNLPSVTEVVSPLRSFTLIGDCPIGLSLNWEVVAIALDKRRQISNPFLSSQLTTLRLDNVSNVPSTLFSICINLTDITFQNVELQPSSPHTHEAENNKLSRPRLLALKLVLFSRKNLLDRLFPPGAPPLVDLHSLRNLMIMPCAVLQNEDLVAVRELMAISKDSLYRFTWNHWQFIPPDHFELQPPPSPVDLSLFPALRMLEIPLMVDFWQESYWTVCFLLSTVSNSPITLDKLKIVICLDVGGKDNDNFVDGEETEDDDVSEEPENDTSYVARIGLNYSGLRWRRLVNVILRTSRSKSGISEFNPIARHILFDFFYPRPDSYFSQKQKETHRFDWEKSISSLVKKEFYKLDRGGDTFKFEYNSRENRD